MVISWNGPKVQHCDSIVKDTLDKMYGKGTWHFVRTCGRQDKIKFYEVSKTVDSMQREHSSFYI